MTSSRCHQIYLAKSARKAKQIINTLSATISNCVGILCNSVLSNFFKGVKPVVVDLV